MKPTSSEHQQQWYIRRGEVVRGPFTKEKITHFLLLGRIKKNDELSLDQAAWRLATEFPQLLPSQFFEESDDALLRQRLMAKKQWEAQRLASSSELPNQQRRLEADDKLVEHALVRALESPEISITEKTRLSRGKKTSKVVAGVVAFSILSAMVVMIYLVQPAPEIETIDCTVTAAPKVNWSNCQMEAAQLAQSNLVGATMQNMNLMRADLRGSQLVGVNLSFSNLSATLLNGADLRQARLVGVSLKGADLSGVQFDGADLSYADLAGANISGANFSGAKLDKTIWIDGRICAVGAIGDCR